MDNNNNKVTNRKTNATRLVIKCDNYNHWRKGQKYSFVARVMGLCGYGNKGDTYGYYPRSGGESCFGSFNFFSPQIDGTSGRETSDLGIKSENVGLPVELRMRS